MLANSKIGGGGYLNNLKKGFTLIELLAVIVILAIIALIATPVVYKIINDAKISAFKNKIYAIDKASNTYYENLILEGNEEEFTKGLDGTYSLTLDLSKQSDKEKLEIKGKTISKGLVTITDEGKVSITALDDKLCGQKLSSSEVINMLSIKDDFACYLLDSSSSDIGTNDILIAIQNLKDSNQALIASNEELTTKVSDLEETIKNINNNGIGTINALNKIYPVGSIYISTNLKTAEEVKENLGGEWESYGIDRVLRGTTGEANQTGGNSNVSLTTANLPSHSHSYTPAGTVTSTFTGSKVNTTSAGAHTHTVSGTAASAGAHTHVYDYPNKVNHGDWDNWAKLYGFVFDGSWSQYNTTSAGAHTHTISGRTGGASSNHTHQVTAAGTVESTFKGTASNTGTTGSNTSFSVLDPYITVYMYKRKS